jgi:glycosyltransferase involved in cell wall biosynthesis
MPETIRDQSTLEGARGGDARPLVSVIIPSYNYAHFIGQAIECLQSQTYAQWECLIIDDGSTDETAEVVSRYSARDRRIKYHKQPNQGLAASRNAGLKLYTGSYVQFLDADDLLEERKFELQVEYLEGRPEVDIVYSGVRYFSTERMDERLLSMWGEDGPWMPGVSGAGGEVLKALTRSNIMVVNAPLLRKRLVDEVGAFDGRLKGSEDWGYWVRCAVAGARFEYRDLDGTRALVRAHTSSMSRDRWLMESRRLFVRQVIESLASDGEVLKLNRELYAAEAGELFTRTLVRERAAVAVDGREIERLNNELAAEELAASAINEVALGRRAQGCRRLLSASAKSGTLSRRLAFFAGALIAPVAPRRTFGSTLASVARVTAGTGRRLKSAFNLGAGETVRGHDE